MNTLKRTLFISLVITACDLSHRPEEPVEHQVNRVVASIEQDHTSCIPKEMLASDQKTVLVFQGARPWPNGIIPYKIEEGVHYKTLAINSMQDWMDVVPSIKFVPQTTETVYLAIHEYSDPNDRRSGFASGVGYDPGGRILKLNSEHLPHGPDDDSLLFSTATEEATAVIRHELGHVLGLPHEQSRADRDSTIKVLWCNIPEEVRGQFHKENLPDPGYIDPASIMLYGAFQASDHTTAESTVTFPKIGTEDRAALDQAAATQADATEGNEVLNPSLPLPTMVSIADGLVLPLFFPSSIISPFDAKSVDCFYRWAKHEPIDESCTMKSGFPTP